MLQTKAGDNPDRPASIQLGHFKGYLFQRPPCRLVLMRKLEDDEAWHGLVGDTEFRMLSLRDGAIYIGLFQDPTKTKMVVNLQSQDKEKDATIYAIHLEKTKDEELIDCIRYIDLEESTSSP